MKTVRDCDNVDFRALEGVNYADCVCGQKKNFAEVSFSTDQYVEGSKTNEI